MADNISESKDQITIVRNRSMVAINSKALDDKELSNMAKLVDIYLQILPDEKCDSDTLCTILKIEEKELTTYIEELQTKNYLN